MAEYFDWVNVNKKEYLYPHDFDCGAKFHETWHRDNVVLRALYELLAGPWQGDPIVFIGDDINIPEDTPYGLLRELHTQAAGGDHLDHIYENYRNMSCLFQAAETEVREKIGYYLEDVLRVGTFKNENEYGIDIRRPFAGLFGLTGKSFRYIVNHTKKAYYSLGETPILYKDGTPCEYVDPLPLLLGFGRSTDPGVWLGDVVGVADEVSSDYEPLKEVYLDW